MFSSPAAAIIGPVRGQSPDMETNGSLGERVEDDCTIALTRQSDLPYTSCKRKIILRVSYTAVI